MKNVCSQCGNQLPAGSKFCPKCGTPFQEQIEEVELGEVTKINHKNQSKMSGVPFKTISKKRISMIVAVIIIAVIAFFLLNRNPLQGNWVSTDDYTKGDIIVKGEKADITLVDFGGEDITFSGPLHKINKKDYQFLVADADMTITSRDVIENKEEFNEIVDVMKNELSELPLKKSEKKKLNKWIKSIQPSGNDITWTLSVKDFNEMSEILTEVSSLYDNDLLEEEFILSKKGDNKLSLTVKGEMDDLIFQKTK